MDDGLPKKFTLPADRAAVRRQLLIEEVSMQAERRSRRWMVAPVALAVLLAVLAPAVAFGDGIFSTDEGPTSPEEARQQTGVAPRVFAKTTYDRFEAAVLLYKDGEGRTCIASRFGTRSDGPGTQYECLHDSALFQGPGPDDPRQAVDVFGPASAQEPNRADFDPTTWDKMWFYGLTSPEVARVTVVMSDCSTRPASVDAARFDGNGVFLFLVPRADLHRRVWPYWLVAENAAGERLYDRPIAGVTVPGTKEAESRGVRRPVPSTDCGSVG